MAEGDFLARAGAFLIPDIDCPLPGGNPPATVLRTVSTPKGEKKGVLSRGGVYRRALLLFRVI